MKRFPLNTIGQLSARIPPRLLCGPGPSNCNPRVHAAMALPQLGHLDPDFMTIMEDTKALLRYTMQTENVFTLPVSGTGSAAWEAAVANLTRPGDIHLVFVSGYFGLRHIDMAPRYGATIIREDVPWGTAFDTDYICNSIRKHKPDLVWICLAETSTGVLQPLEGVGECCRSLDKECLLLVDSVTGLGGVPFFCDQLKIDACYSGGQKCLSAPPGASPLTLGPRALHRMSQRKDSVKNWYLDMNSIAKYLFAEKGAPRQYHHTAPIINVYAIREALTIIAEEGLEETWKRHQETGDYFIKLIEEMGLEPVVKDPKIRLPNLITIKVPSGVDAAKVVTHCREKFNIEIGTCLGELAGKAWRVGLMGYNSRKDVALTVAAALKDALHYSGF